MFFRIYRNIFVHIQKFRPAYTLGNTHLSKRSRSPYTTSPPRYESTGAKLLLGGSTITYPSWGPRGAWPRRS